MITKLGLSTLKDPNKKIYVGIDNGKKIGVTRFDFDKNFQKYQ